MKLKHLQMDPLLSEQALNQNFQGNISKKNVYLVQGLTKDTTNKPGAVQPSQVSKETENCKEQVGHGNVCNQHIYRFSQSWCFVYSNF